MIRRNGKGLPNNMLIIKKWRLEQRSAKLVKFYLTLYQEEGCLFVNERAIVRLSCRLSETLFSRGRSNLEYTDCFGGKCWESVLSSNCNFLLKLLLLQQFLNTSFNKDSTLQKLCCTARSIPVGPHLILCLQAFRYWFLVAAVRPILTVSENVFLLFHVIDVFICSI